ncbi:CRM-domain containing factor CFM2, chloroplastic isoform X2 [Prunus dulcis]|uniref:CRM-domain containing factor CFM2, chloroplastic isoform X2 n=1 Tax=Prunus dulcis TaxID=3755 RepID=UPI0014826E4A|nr:CRM-domain containing factor CFM2, chloroplastic isoform X2 [Prunus dulcis]
MLLPLTHLPASPFPPKILTDQSLSPFFSFPKTLPSQNPKPSKFAIRSSTTGTKTLAPKSAIQRIAEKLRSLGFTENNEKPQPQPDTKYAGEIFVPLPQRLPKYRVGHTLDSSWSTPENPVPEPGTGRAIARFHELRRVVKKQKELEKTGKKEERVPTLAELSLGKGELRRLTTVGIGLRKKLKIGKAGITEGIVNGIHENWRRSEVVKIVCEDLCRMNMKRTHDMLERKTGGLVVWRSGSKIVLYRGVNYKYPYFLRDKVDEDSTIDTSHNALPDAHINDGINEISNEVNSAIIPSTTNERAQPMLVKGVGLQDRVRFQLPGEAQLTEEADRMLEGLGPRFTDWWGYEPLPVDADLLPAIVPGYRKPFRLLPYGLKPKLTDDEMTTIRRLGRPLPCHFALGRNRNLQGLASSIVKLWEKCEIAKIAVKRGVQNTNTEIMAEELKRLTGGTLLARDREFIVLYRGKDFLPPAVSSAIEERRKYAIHAEKQIAVHGTSVTTRQELEPRTELENKHEWTNDHKMGLPSAKRKLKCAEVVVNRTSIKLSMALEKKAKAEKLLAELENSAIPQQPEIDKEGITKEERYMLRKVGLRMKPFLLMGRRGVFDGTIENMHLHWKYRELVKIICNEKSIEAVQQIAQTLEAESGGILVAVERVSKGYAIIVYRGKNYSRPASLRPQTLLNKREAMKRSIEAQRRESLKLHVLRLNENIDELKLLLVKDKEADNMQSVGESRNELARDKQEAHVTPVNLNDGMGAVVNGQLATQQDEVISFSSTWDEDEIGKFEPGSSNESVTNEEDEIGKVEPGPSNESVTNETCANFLKDTNGEVGDFVSTCFPEDVMGRGKQEAHVTPMKLNDGMGTIVNGQLATQQDKVITFSSICCEDENGEVEPVSSSEPVTNETHAKLFKDVNGEEGVSISTSFPEDAMHRVSEIEAKDSSGRFGNSESEPSVPVMVRKDFNERPLKSLHLSNGERLLLRKQALKMKKRPVLAVGRNNIVSGVAKTIKAHFEKHPLAIVNVKGRAKGTSVREVVLKLEQATGGVLVSQEPSKVILYRGWGAAGDNDRKASNTGKKVSTQGAVSPELLAAIRLECGFKSPGNEDAMPTAQVGI